VAVKFGCENFGGVAVDVSMPLVARGVAVAGWQWYQSTRLISAVRLTPTTPHGCDCGSGCVAHNDTTYHHHKLFYFFFKFNKHKSQKKKKKKYNSYTYALMAVSGGIRSALSAPCTETTPI
jgi:hypothetical protein